MKTESIRAIFMSLFLEIKNWAGGGPGQVLVIA